jgi:hypothetical protein
LILVPRLHHNDALPPDVWDEIEPWIAAAMERPARAV